MPTIDEPSQNRLVIIPARISHPGPSQHRFRLVWLNNAPPGARFRKKRAPGQGIEFETSCLEAKVGSARRHQGEAEPSAPFRRIKGGGRTRSRLAGGASSGSMRVRSEEIT
jgi:hypothetical protein